MPICIARIEVHQRRADTPVQVHWCGSDLAMARDVAAQLSLSDDGTAHVVDYGHLNPRDWPEGALHRPESSWHRGERITL